MKKSPLSKEDQNYLLKIYPFYTNGELAVTFGVPKHTIDNFGYKHCLHKTKEHIAGLRHSQAVKTNNKRWKK